MAAPIPPMSPQTFEVLRRIACGVGEVVQPQAERAAQADPNEDGALALSVVNRSKDVVQQVNTERRAAYRDFKANLARLTEMFSNGEHGEHQ
jgi:hypothetical protein